MLPRFRHELRLRRLDRKGAAYVEYAMAVLVTALFSIAVANSLFPALEALYDRARDRNATTHAPYCVGCIDLGELGVSSLDRGLDDGHAQINANGYAVTLTGPSWKTVPFTHVIKPRTTLSFEIETSGAGSLQGIALQKKKSAPDEDRLFQIFGRDSWGIPDYHAGDPVAGRTYRVEIPIGQYYPGRIWQIVLVSDGDLETVFSRIRVVDHQPGNGVGPNDPPPPDPGPGKQPPGQGKGPKVKK